MRFFLLLAAVLALDSIAQAHVTPFQLPGPFVDGTIITFFFWHEGVGQCCSESVNIDFYDHPVNFDWNGGQYDRPAHLRIERNLLKPVSSDTFYHGRWIDRVQQQQTLDEMPATSGWWRVDVIKMDSHQLNVFFQGYWSGVREFYTSLDNIRSVYIDSPSVDAKFVEIRVKTPNANLAPISIEQMKTFFKRDSDNVAETRLVTLADFPIGSRLELVAVLQASRGENKHRKFPSLVFSPVGAQADAFFGIRQAWIDGAATQRLELFTFNNEVLPTMDLCTADKPNGDLQHLHLERISKDVIRARVLYKPAAAADAGRITCEITVPSAISDRMDRPFEIISHQGALIFHIEHMIARGVVKDYN